MVDFQERDTRRGIGGDEGGGDDDSVGETEETGESQHENHGHGTETRDLSIAVLTVSSTRTVDEDPSGDAIAELCEDAGHAVATRDAVTDDHDRIQKTVDTLTRRKDVDAVITTGGTGVTPDDVTIEAVRPLFEKTLPGFGELFRRYSEEEIGTRIVATRATAGIAGGVPVFCLPGSENAVRLGTGEIILEEAGHLVHLAGRGST